MEVDSNNSSNKLDQKENRDISNVLNNNQDIDFQ